MCRPLKASDRFLNTSQSRYQSRAQTVQPPALSAAKSAPRSTWQLFLSVTFCGTISTVRLAATRFRERCDTLPSPFVFMYLLLDVIEWADWACVHRRCSIPHADARLNHPQSPGGGFHMMHRRCVGIMHQCHARMRHVQQSGSPTCHSWPQLHAQSTCAFCGGYSLDTHTLPALPTHARVGRVVLACIV